ncbi:MAG TPA: transcription elongation factor GreA [Candidatus Cloacimonas sp.]|nr:transcription elongation factor GreA [Candidatus Cloacimonadota bacterium]HOQ78174.1 transcription elongation factor GreA [Candidatus Cloacimonas sp.]HOU25518.1 transcription elongation factor GreA [Candidatus Cloacimonas sp.]HPK60502.1 transcription elongation factor GreA [Candidatus Cloacimonas sp.]HPN26875.1 transcription elongation factor GreA [Candidatus Cloacimonas sp.]
MDLSQYITKTGMQRLQKRINELLTERPEVIKAIAIAREFGDLSENAEYKAARERQRAIDNEIDYLRCRSAKLQVIDTSEFPKDIVRFGSYCVAEDISNNECICYHLVGADELNYYDEEGIQEVSVVSPIGRALLSKKIGEIAVVHAPMGERHLKVIEIK